MLENLSVTEPLAYGAHRAAQERERWPGGVQASKPSPESGGIGYPIGIFDRRRGVFQRTVFLEIALDRLASGDPDVVALRRREWRQDGERFFATFADAPANGNPIMVFVVSLFTASAMADDGLL